MGLASQTTFSPTSSSSLFVTVASEEVDKFLGLLFLTCFLFPTRFGVAVSGVLRFGVLLGLPSRTTLGQYFFFIGLCFGLSFKSTPLFGLLFASRFCNGVEDVEPSAFRNRQCYISYLSNLIISAKGVQKFSCC